MIGESIGLAIEKTVSAAVKAGEAAELGVIKAGEVAELGAIKPNGFGSLIRERFSSEVAQQQIDGLYSSEFPHLNTRLNLFGPRAIKENSYLSLRYNDISKECSEYLCDYGITPEVWKEATLGQRMEMLGKAAEIIGKELNLPENWVKGIKPVAVSGEDYMAQASCSVRPLNNGGVDIIGIPTLNVNVNYLTDDYLEAMSTVYHEMIHMKQYASIDCVAPGLTTDTRLLDLIKDLKTNRGTPKTRVSYLYSPYEAEAWAQESYFRKMLEAVILDRKEEFFCDDLTLRRLPDEMSNKVANAVSEAKPPRHITTINEGLDGQTYPGTNVEYRRRTITLNGEKVEGVFPRFESRFDTTLPKDLLTASDTEQFRYCTQKLAEQIENSPEFAAQFTPRQIEQIKNTEPRISGLTWHHNELPGKMQLVNADVHNTCRHTGGRSIWGGGTDCR